MQNDAAFGWMTLSSFEKHTDSAQMQNDAASGWMTLSSFEKDTDSAQVQNDAAFGWMTLSSFEKMLTLLKCRTTPPSATRRFRRCASNVSLDESETVKTRRTVLTAHKQTGQARNRTLPFLTFHNMNYIRRCPTRMMQLFTSHQSSTTWRNPSTM